MLYLLAGKVLCEGPVCDIFISKTYQQHSGRMNGTTAWATAPTQQQRMLFHCTSTFLFRLVIQEKCTLLDMYGAHTESHVIRHTSSQTAKSERECTDIARMQYSNGASPIAAMKTASSSMSQKESVATISSKELRNQHVHHTLHEIWSYQPER